MKMTYRKWGFIVFAFLFVIGGCQLGSSYGKDQVRAKNKLSLYNDSFYFAQDRFNCNERCDRLDSMNFWFGRLKSFDDSCKAAIAVIYSPDSNNRTAKETKIKNCNCQ